MGKRLVFGILFSFPEGVFKNNTVISYKKEMK